MGLAHGLIIGLLILAAALDLWLYRHRPGRTMSEAIRRDAYGAPDHAPHPIVPWLIGFLMGFEACHLFGVEF